MTMFEVLGQRAACWPLHHHRIAVQHTAVALQQTDWRLAVGSPLEAPARPCQLTPGRGMRSEQASGAMFSHGLQAQAGDGEGLPNQALDKVETCLYLAKMLYQGKRCKEALVIIEQAIARHPTNVELLYLRGLCLQALNNTPAAFATFMSLLNMDPMHLGALSCVGAIYKARGMLQESLVAYQRALEAAPGSSEVASALAGLCVDLGCRAKVSGGCSPAGTSEALAYYQRAIELCPSYAPAYYHIGVLYSENKQLDVALTWYQSAVRYCPTYAEAHCNIGVIHKERGDLEAAIQSYEKALEAASNFTIVKNNLAIALTDLGTRVKMAGRVADGIALYERALACNPRYADALYNLGVAHGECGHIDKAIFMYETAVQYNPACAEAYNNLGVIYKERDNLERAMECYTAALTIKPNFPQSLNNMGVIFTCQGRAQEALTLLTAAIAACPAYAEAYNNLGVLQRDVGNIPQALASYTRCLELAPDSRNAGQNRLLALNYIYNGDEEDVCTAHADWGNRFVNLFKPLPSLGRADRDLSLTRPLRIGYISPDLFTHSVSYFAEAPITHHNTPGRHTTDKTSTPTTSDVSAQDAHHKTPRGAPQGGAAAGAVAEGAAGLAKPLHLVHHVVYCCAPKRDSKTARLKSNVLAGHGTWREVTHLSEPDLAQLVREDEIDILVELTGHTANNRLGVMAMRPAPVQVTWIGYPNSTGLQAIDYRITDELCDPLDTKQTFVEELVHMPGGTFLCYTPAHDAPPVAATPALAAGFVTFGSFNNMAKITPQVLALWARILKAVPNSRLVLKNKPFACDTARMHVLNLLAAEGIESWRVDLLPLAAANCDHLATYALMDISLDTFPYAGTTTTCESMYMGVPCLTLAGKGHAHNVGVSLITSVGLQEDWVAYSPDQYVDLAVRHASDIPGLAALRDSLRERMLKSRLCDAPRFVAELEGVYHNMWTRHVAKVLAPQHVDTAAVSGAVSVPEPTVSGAPGAAVAAAQGEGVQEASSEASQPQQQQQAEVQQVELNGGDALVVCTVTAGSAGSVPADGGASGGVLGKAGEVVGVSGEGGEAQQGVPGKPAGSRPCSPGTPGLLDVDAGPTSISASPTRGAAA